MRCVIRRPVSWSRKTSKRGDARDRGSHRSHPLGNNPGDVDAIDAAAAGGVFRGIPDRPTAPAISGVSAIGLPDWSGMGCEVHWLSGGTGALMDRCVGVGGAPDHGRRHAPLGRVRGRADGRAGGSRLVMWRAPDGVGAPTEALTAPLLTQEYGVEIFNRSSPGPSPPRRPPTAHRLVRRPAATAQAEVAAHFVAGVVSTACGAARPVSRRLVRSHGRARAGRSVACPAAGGDRRRGSSGPSRRRARHPAWRTTRRVASPPARCRTSCSGTRCMVDGRDHR